MERIAMLAVAGLALIVVGCGSDQGPASAPEIPATVGPAEAVGPATASVPESTGTPQPLTREELSEFFRRNAHDVDAWPRGYDLQINEELEVRFSYPAQLADWIASAFIRHLPSRSSLGLNQNGFITHDGVNGVEATAAMCEALNDQELMGRITARASEINAYTFGQRPLDELPCTSNGSFGRADVENAGTASGRTEPDALRMVYDRHDWPAEYRRYLSEDVEVQFAYPIDGVKWSAPIFVWYLPSSRTVSVNLDGRVDWVDREDGPEAIAAACGLLSDRNTMSELRSRAEEINAMLNFSRPFEPDPCGRAD